MERIVLRHIPRPCFPSRLPSRLQKRRWPGSNMQSSETRDAYWEQESDTLWLFSQLEAMDRDMLIFNVALPAYTIITMVTQPVICDANPKCLHQAPIDL